MRDYVKMFGFEQNKTYYLKGKKFVLKGDTFVAEDGTKLKINGYDDLNWLEQMQGEKVCDHNCKKCPLGVTCFCHPMVTEEGTPLKEILDKADLEGPALKVAEFIERLI